MPFELNILDLPGNIAVLNGMSAVFLTIAYVFARRGQTMAHRVFILFALTCSALFLGGYLWYHAHAGVVYYGGEGLIRTLYLLILITHTILAIAVVPAVIFMITTALKPAKRHLHRKYGHMIFAIWLYVSVTGVVVYWMLKPYLPTTLPENPLLN